MAKMSFELPYAQHIHRSCCMQGEAATKIVVKIVVKCLKSADMPAKRKP